VVAADGGVTDSILLSSTISPEILRVLVAVCFVGFVIFHVWGAQKRRRSGLRSHRQRL
jgi:hypothetical protein